MAITHRLDVWGDLACFTRPEAKVERFSYPVITPSAARGIFDSIYWEGQRSGSDICPYFYWQITRIELFRMPRYIALRRNEVKGTVPGTAVLNKWMNGTLAPQPLVADSDDETTGRTQRQTMALKDVRYRLHAQIRVMPEFASQSQKFDSMFSRRAARGQCFQQPYFGCREFPAYFEPAHTDLVPINHSQALGLMLYDVFDLRRAKVNASAPPFISLYRAQLRQGVIDVPAYESPDVLKPEG